MEKGMKIARIINKILGVFFWICVVSGVLILGAGLFAVLAKGEDIGHGIKLSMSVALGNCTVSFNDWTPEQYRVLASANLLGAIILFPFACWAIRILQKIFRAVGEGQPFNGEISPALRRLAWVELIAGIVRFAAERISSWLTMRVLDVTSLFDMSKVTDVKLRSVADFSFLVTFVVILLMSFVFQYGEKLQQLSDETL